MRNSLLFLTLSLSVVSTQAQVIVELGSSAYITGNLAPASQWVDTAGAAPASIAYNSGFSTIYSGTSGLPAFGAGAYVGTSTGSNNNFINGADAGLDAVQLDGGSNTIGSGGALFAALIMFEKANFHNGGDSSAVDLGTGSSLSARATNNQNIDNNLDARWVIQQTDNTYAISDSTGFFADAGTYTTLSSGELSSLNWFSFDETDLTTIGSSITADFTDVQGVGVYASVNTGFRTQFRISEFDAVAVPEPSTYAILLGVMALGFVMWRRRNA